MILDDSLGQNYYNIIVDGSQIERLKGKKGKKTYLIAKGLTDTIHEIEIFKLTEEMFGKTRFYGFVAEQGTTIVPIENERKKMIEYIGNSITCGYGNEGQNGEIFGPSTENHYMTYAAITSRNFNARHLAVCKSGIGAYRNWDGPSEGNADCMANYYSRIFLYDEYPLYAFKDQPDLVCINLGTNDFSTQGGDTTQFMNSYLRLIDTIQSKYYKPDIVCLLGPMLSGPVLEKVRNCLQYIADSANLKEAGIVTIFEMSEQTGELGMGIDYHPSVGQHKKNARELTAYIKKLKGWETVIDQ